MARLATIPHGTAVLAQGHFLELGGGPRSARPTRCRSRSGAGAGPGTANPFPEYNLAQPNQFRTAPTPGGVTQAMVTDPNSMLVHDIADQKITETVVLTVSSVPPAGITTFGGAEDIPFLGPNASVAQFSAIFWIEKVEYGDRRFLPNCSTPRPCC